MSSKTLIVFFAAFVGVACNAILSLDHYRACTGAECGDASADASTDAPDDVVAATCNASSECKLPAVACSNNRCAKVSTLVEGTVSHECVILDDQTMWCWGLNDHGQLGRGVIGLQYDQPAPVTVLPGTDGIVQGAMGGGYSCALTTKGEVWCWGDGIAGSGGSYAQQVSLGVKAIAISGGSGGACAHTADGSIVCWGDDGYGDLGCGDAGTSAPIYPLSPHALLPPSASIAGFAVGAQGTCAYENATANVHCFGNAAWGILGDGTPQQNDKSCQTSSFTISGANGLESMTNSDYAACAKDANGNFFCWGMNYVYTGAGLIWPANDASTITSPFQIPPVNPTLRQISIGWEHSCDLDVAGKVQCWGLSGAGETGATFQQGVVRPPTTINVAAATAIAAHRQFTCALLNGGSVVCWGTNEFQAIGPQSLGTVVPTPTTIAF